MDHTSKAIDRPKIANLRQRPPLGDEMHTPAMRQKRAHDTSFKLLENATRRVDSARGNAQKVLAAIQTKLAGPPLCKDATTALLHGEFGTPCAPCRSKMRRSDCGRHGAQ
jgi:hypothetical protein